MAFSRSTADIIYDNSKFHLTNGIKMWIIIKYYRFATLAQLAEHLIRNERVVGSNPISGSSKHAVPEKSGAVFLFWCNH